MTEQDNPEKRSLFDERYRIEGTNMFSLSKWSRENEYHAPPSYKVGDVVVLTVVTQITRVYQDCDGTTLYAFENGLNGYPEDDDMRLATDEENDTF